MSDAAAAMIQLVDELARARGRTTTAFRSIRASRGLSEMESVVLPAVVNAHRAPTVSQIARSLGHARQVIQRAADALQVRGLIAFEDNPDHKRARLLVPTAQGRATQREGDALGLALAGALTRGMDARQLAETAEGLRAIRIALEANLRGLAEAEPDDDA